MSRIQKAYEAQFEALLQKARARRLPQGVQWLVSRARKLCETTGVSEADALTHVYADLANRPALRARNSKKPPALFYCDAGLGGLARWLRAAGYEALWQAGIDDHELLREARTLSATVLTTDSMLMERRVLRDHIIPAFWVPPTLTIPEQLTLVFREFDLEVRESRCMTCGGELRRVDKESLHEQIPPKTYRWQDEFFVCSRCGKLFWHGTHWQRIRRQLSDVIASLIGQTKTRDLPK